MFLGSKIGLGLDVDDLSLELVALESGAGAIKRVAVSRVVLPVGIISNGVIKNEQKLAEAIKLLFASAKPKSIKPAAVVFGVPHSQFYPALVELALTDEKQIKTEIWRLAQENLPVIHDDLVLDFKILSTELEKTKVLMVGASRSYLLAWQKFLKGIAIEVELFDVSAYALWRDLALDNKTETVAVVDIGARKSNVFVFNQDQLNYSYDFEIGSHHLTKVIADKLAISREEAEEQKIKRGLDKQLLVALEIALYDFAKELVVALTDYQSKTGETIKQIKLVGGGAKLKGLVSYLQEKIPLAVSLGVLKKIQPGDDTLFTEASGLAIRALNPSHYDQEPFFALDKVFDRNNQINKVDAKSKATSELELSDELEDDQGLKKLKKFKMEKKILVLLIVLAVVALAGAYWYSHRARVLNDSVETAALSFSQTQSFPYKLPIELEMATSSAEFVSGRIITDQVDQAESYDQALLNSRNKLLASLGTDEELWAEPLNEVIDKSQLNYPLTFRWLAFNKAELLKLALARVDNLNIDKLPYEFNTITKNKLEKTDSLDKLYLYGELTISLNQKINNDQIVDLSSLASSTLAVTTTLDVATSTPELASTSLATEVMVVITKTETGWLNARKGPGREFEVLTKLYPQETYQWLDEQGEWWQLSLASGEKVWILSKYAKKQ